jgi:hypothetical protein
MGASLLQGKDLGDAIGQFAGGAMTMIESSDKPANFGFAAARSGHKQRPVVGHSLDIGH